MMRSDGDWNTNVFRDLEDLVRAWEQRASPSATAVVHVGFARSPARVYDDIAVNFPSKVLLTEGAKYTLPKGYQSTPQPVGICDGGPLFLATQGWGYEVSYNQPTVAAVNEAQHFKDWLSSFVSVNPTSEASLRTFGIVDDLTYLSKEAALPMALRRELGVFRFRALDPVPDDPSAIALAAPPWVRQRRFADMQLTMRLKNVFANLRIDSVSDLDIYPSSTLLNTPNLGRTSIGFLNSLLMSAILAGPVDHVAALQSLQHLGLMSALRRSLMASSERDRVILASRMGLDGEPATLAEIGLRHDISGERVRQIEAKALRRLLAAELWDDLLTNKLRERLAHREYPLPLRGIEAVDPWFDGLAERPHVLRYLLGVIPEAGAGIVEVDGVEFIALMKQESWEAAIKSGKRLLAGGVGQKWSEEKCRRLVQALLPERGAEFRNLLWIKASSECHFIEDGGVRFLHQYGRGADQLVETILEESDRPLHYTEIANRASSRAGRPIDDRRAHNAAASVGLLFGRGTYGVKKHVPIDAASVEVLVDATEDLMSEFALDRQWHSAEILAALAERQDLPPKLDKYILDIVLRSSGQLRRHGRMVWTQRGGDDEAGRIDIRQAIIATLEAAKAPLRSRDIMQRLIAVRGLSQHFQIIPADPLIRLGPSLWGLNDRDVPIKRDDQPWLHQALVEELERRGVGIHITEIKDAVSLPESMPAEAIFSIATLDVRLRVNIGQYLYLQQWKDARRISIPDAVREVLGQTTQFTDFDHLMRVVESKVGRACRRPAISSALQAIGAEFDGQSGWRIGVKDDEEDSDVLIGESAEAAQITF